MDFSEKNGYPGRNVYSEKNDCSEKDSTEKNLFPEKASTV